MATIKVEFNDAYRDAISVYIDTPTGLTAGQYLISSTYNPNQLSFTDSGMRFISMLRGLRPQLAKRGIKDMTAHGTHSIKLIMDKSRLSVEGAAEAVNFIADIIGEIYYARETPKIEKYVERPFDESMLDFALARSSAAYNGWVFSAMAGLWFVVSVCYAAAALSPFDKGLSFGIAAMVSVTLTYFAAIGARKELGYPSEVSVD